MRRLRLYDLRLSRFPTVIGACVGDIPTIAQFANSAQERLLMCRESGDEGWWGTWAEIAFNVSRTQPYITLPRQIARLELADLCKEPIPINNQFVEYLEFGNGRMPKCASRCGWSDTQGFTRNNAVTFVDLSGTKFIRAYLSSQQDLGKRILFSGLDANNVLITSQNGVDRVEGIFLTLQSPFVTTATAYSRITGIQKDVTVGDVLIFSVDQVTGEETLLLTMEPTEQTAWYRRYYFDKLPINCCATTPEDTTVQIHAIAKLDLIPALVDTDYLLIQSLEALIEEGQSVRYSTSDAATAKQLEMSCHKNAVGYLNGQLTHYLGTSEPAVQIKPFGSARLERASIGTLI